MPYYRWTPVKDLQPGDKLDLFRDKIANRRGVDEPYRFHFPQVEEVHPVSVGQGDGWYTDGDLLEVWVRDPDEKPTFVRFPKHHEVKVVD